MVLAHGRQNLPFQKIQHQVVTKDAQPSSETGAIMVQVTGQLLVRDVIRSALRDLWILLLSTQRDTRSTKKSDR